MEIDLQQLRADIEKELRQLEERRSALNEQLIHIESVERMASKTLRSGGSDERVSRSAGSTPEDSARGGEGKSWFRR